METKTQSSKPNPIMPKDSNLSLDEYHSFIHSNKQIGLVVRKLIQIIGMHGFSKFKKFTKNVMIEAVKSIDLMEPSRSTRNDGKNVSSNAFMTLDEAISDLKQLNWQECCVTSIRTVNSVNYCSVLGITAGAPVAGKELKRSRKRPRRQALQRVAGDRVSRSVCSSVGLGRPVDGVCAEEDE